MESSKSKSKDIYTKLSTYKFANMGSAQLKNPSQVAELEAKIKALNLPPHLRGLSKQELLKALRGKVGALGGKGAAASGASAQAYNGKGQPSSGSIRAPNSGVTDSYLSRLPH